MKYLIHFDKFKYKLYRNFFFTSQAHMLFYLLFGVSRSFFQERKMTNMKFVYKFIFRMVNVIRLFEMTWQDSRVEMGVFHNLIMRYFTLVSHHEDFVQSWKISFIFLLLFRSLFSTGANEKLNFTRICVVIAFLFNLMFKTLRDEESFIPSYDIVLLDLKVGIINIYELVDLEWKGEIRYFSLV